MVPVLLDVDAVTVMLYVPAGVPPEVLVVLLPPPPHAVLNNNPPANNATKQSLKNRLCLCRDTVNPASPIGANQMA